MKKEKKWQFALSQHPMYFLIREDTQCAERTPPWGAPSIEEYIDRVKRNLDSVMHNEIKIGFEWSAHELELLRQDSPKVFEIMLNLLKDKKISFYNGTYAQPHLQILSHEANFRQFEEGIKFYRDVCGFPVTCYIHQEASVHDQIPQLMNHFGLRYSSIPQMGATIEWLKGGVINFMGGQKRFIHGDEFTKWQGLDGSQVSLYLSTVFRNEVENELVEQEMAGFFRIPPLLFDTPDLLEIDDEWMARYANTDFVLLDDAFPQREKEAPATSTARFFSQWSYIEGIYAEALSRQNLKAERAVVQAESLEAMAYVLTGKEPLSLKTVWKEILALQHHDVYCFCAPELKKKAIKSLEKNEDTSKNTSLNTAQYIVKKIGASNNELVVFNTSAHRLETIIKTNHHEDLEIIDSDGKTLPSDCDETGLRFKCCLDGWGYKIFKTSRKNLKKQKDVWDKPYFFESENFKALVSPEGIFTSLIVGNQELLRGNSNVVNAVDSLGLSPWRKQMGKRNNWQPPGDGKRLNRTCTPGVITTSDLGVTLVSNGLLGNQVSADLKIQFYYQLPRIDFIWRFTFDKTTIGTFYDDYSKLHLSWDLGFKGEISHDIPFGVIETSQGRPIHPVSWVDISDGEKGIAYFHQGTLKHWVENNVLYNLFAWGENTEAIGSRMWRYNWPKAFDHRLEGTHEIYYSIYPHSSNWKNNVCEVAKSVNEEPLALFGSGNGSCEPEKQLLQLNGGLNGTSIFYEDNNVKCRLYRYSDRLEKLMGSLNYTLKDLKGDEVNDLNVFQIGFLELGND